MKREARKNDTSMKARRYRLKKARLLLQLDREPRHRHNPHPLMEKTKMQTMLNRIIATKNNLNLLNESVDLDNSIIVTTLKQENGIEQIDQVIEDFKNTEKYRTQYDFERSIPGWSKSGRKGTKTTTRSRNSRNTRRYRNNAKTFQSKSFGGRTSGQSGFRKSNFEFRKSANFKSTFHTTELRLEFVENTNRSKSRHRRMRASNQNWTSQQKRIRQLSVKAVPFRSINTELVRINEKFQSYPEHDAFDKTDFDYKSSPRKKIAWREQHKHNKKSSSHLRQSTYFTDKDFLSKTYNISSQKTGQITSKFYRSSVMGSQMNIEPDNKEGELNKGILSAKLSEQYIKLGERVRSVKKGLSKTHADLKKNKQQSNSSQNSGMKTDRIVSASESEYNLQKDINDSSLQNNLQNNMENSILTISKEQNNDDAFPAESEMTNNLYSNIKAAGPIIKVSQRKAPYSGSEGANELTNLNYSDSKSTQSKGKLIRKRKIKLYHEAQHFSSALKLNETSVNLDTSSKKRQYLDRSIGSYNGYNSYVSLRKSAEKKQKVNHRLRGRSQPAITQNEKIKGYLETHPEKNTYHYNLNKTKDFLSSQNMVKNLHRLGLRPKLKKKIDRRRRNYSQYIEKLKNINSLNNHRAINQNETLGISKELGHQNRTGIRIFREAVQKFNESLCDMFEASRKENARKRKANQFLIKLKRKEMEERKHTSKMFHEEKHLDCKKLTEKDNNGFSDIAYQWHGSLIKDEGKVEKRNVLENIEKLNSLEDIILEKEQNSEVLEVYESESLTEKYHTSFLHKKFNQTISLNVNFQQY